MPSGGPQQGDASDPASHFAETDASKQRAADAPSGSTTGHPARWLVQRRAYAHV